MTGHRISTSTHSLTVELPLSFHPALDALAEALRRRRIRRNYGKLTDRQLFDIGLTPLDLQSALSLPFGQDAEDALARAAAKEAAKW
jgi:uncharacterized protein YjiS (DUF1127 family)